jgi:hypothetical protein
MPSVDFTVRGERMLISSDDVIRRLRDVTPGPLRKHAVEVDGVTYPVKQAFAKVVGTDLLDFDTNVARRLFQKLGFQVRRVADEPRTAPIAKRPERRGQGKGQK